MNKKGWKIVGLAAAGLVLIAAVMLFNSDPEEGSGATFHAGTIEASNNTSASSSYSSSDEDLFLARRIAVINESDHPVMKKAAHGLVKALKELSLVEEVDVFTDERPAAGGLTYDLYVLLEMPKFDSRGLLATGRKVTAEIKCSIGRGLWHSRHRTTDSLSPALVNPNVEITINHESVSRGVESPNVKYKLVADDITKQLVEQVTKPLQQFASKFGTPRHLPAGLYPSYNPTPALPPPWNERLVEVINGRGFMLHNQTTHTLLTTKPYEDLKTTRDMLEERGWRMDSKIFERGDARRHYYYRATLDNLVAEAFEARDFGPRATNDEVRLVFRYFDRMTREEVGAVFAAEYGEGEIPLDLWLSFSRVLPREMNERMLDRLATEAALPSAVEQRVIRHLEKAGRIGEAKARLRPAYISARIDNSNQAKEILKLGREIMEDEEWKPAEPTAADYEALLIAHAEPGAPIEAEVALGEPARYRVGAADALEIMSITVTRAEIPEGRYRLARGKFSAAGGAQGSSSVTPHGTNQPWRAQMSDYAGGIYWSVVAEEIGEERFKLMIEGRE